MVLSMHFGKYFVILIAAALTACGGSTSGGSPPTETRSFYLGFTPFPYDFNSDPVVLNQIVDDVYNKLTVNADLVTHHFDNGIPWNDALSDTFPYADHIMSDWQTRRDRTPVGHKKYLAITPINIDRNGLSLLRDTADDMPLVTPFDTYAANGDFNVQDVKTAYLNYCKRVITYFNPDFFAIGIETNLLRKNTNATTWAKYVELNHYVYTQLKASYPNLPVFVSVSPVEAIEGYVGESAEFTGDAAGYAASQVSAINDVLTDSDYYAVSLYPYMTNYYASPIPNDLFDNLFALSGKPIAIAETGMLAEDLTAYSVTFLGSEARQNDYVSLLLSKANDYQLKFVNWFVQQDYDQLCDYLGGCTDFQKLWRDTGIYDGTGNTRTSYTTWQQWLARPLN